MRIYVAGKWEEKEHVREIQNTLRKAGHSITHDWTALDLAHEAPAGHIDAKEIYPGKWYYTEELRGQAKADLLGVVDAEVFVAVCVKDYRYAGTFTEMGMALVYDIPVFIIGKYANYNIFTYLPSVTVVDSVKEVIDALHYSNKT